jgi:hypothetical protein
VSFFGNIRFYNSIIKMHAVSAVALFAGLAAAWQSTTYTTLYSTLTECPESVTNCPARTTSQVLPLVTKTVYTTRESTIYKCPATVTNCPLESMTTTTVVEAAYTTVCPLEVTTPYYYPNSTITAQAYPTTTAYESPCVDCTETPAISMTAAVAACPTYSVNTITTSYTTVIPTVVYETVSVPCPTATVAYSNYSTAAVMPAYTAGASSFQGSVALAAAAGLAVLALA